MMNDSRLTGKRRAAVRVSAALVYHDETLLEAEYHAALAAELTPAELVEIILQALLFDGYPCTLEGLILLQKLPEINFPVDELYEEYTPQQIEKWAARGQLLCQNIYRKNFQPLLENVGALSPTLLQWMLHEGYGRVLARPSLSIDVREMGIIAILTVKRYPRQLHSHLKGALHVGVSRRELRQAIEICAPFTTSQNISEALHILEK